MTRHGRARLAVLLGAGCVGAAAWLAASLLRVPEPARAAPSPEEARLDLANLSLPPLDAFPETTRRPLFNVTRTPAAAAAAQTGEEGLILGRYAVVGTVVTDSQRFILLRPADGGGLLRLREGDALDEWRVEAIAADALTLRDGSGTRTVPLRKSSK